MLGKVVCVCCLSYVMLCHIRVCCFTSCSSFVIVSSSKQCYAMFYYALLCCVSLHACLCYVCRCYVYAVCMYPSFWPKNHPASFAWRNFQQGLPRHLLSELLPSHTIHLFSLLVPVLSSVSEKVLSASFSFFSLLAPTLDVLGVTRLLHVALTGFWCWRSFWMLDMMMFWSNLWSGQRRKGAQRVACDLKTHKCWKIWT